MVRISIIYEFFNKKKRGGVEIEFISLCGGNFATITIKDSINNEKSIFSFSRITDNGSRIFSNGEWKW